MQNKLKNEKSPYLLQHMNNPVNWYPWCEEAFEQASNENKPIFLSIGYSTCHWCHVMAHESFEDNEVANILNQNFICIKVDREERPDIDSVYMSVCQAMTGSGGWPLTVFLTPQQKPFFAGTYFPKNSLYGQIGLIELLSQIINLWKNNQQQLLSASDKILDAIKHRHPTKTKISEKELIQIAVDIFSKQFDSQWGGFGSAPKFPTPHNLLFLMQYSLLENKTFPLDMALTTLDAMAKGGIFDHIGGGFCRYSTDKKWLVPHFEKMLYDNALLILAYLKAYQITNNKTYADTAHRTANYILRELTDKQGGFYCGQDADSDGVEGKYYVFTPQEIFSVLGEKDGKDFCELYDITQNGNFEEKNIPNQITQEKNAWQSDDVRLQKLYEYRKNRTKLHKDDKVLLSWNAWTILAFSQAARILEHKLYLDVAMKAQKFIDNHMTDKNDRLYLRWRNHHTAHMGQLDDYAVYSLALLALYESTFDASYLKKAILRAEQMIQLFEDEKQGGYFINAMDAEQLIIRPKETYDGAIPSGNSVALMVLQKLANLTGEVKWQEATNRQVSFLIKEIQNYPPAYSFTLLAMTKLFYSQKQLICSTNQDVSNELLQYLKNNALDNLNILIKNNSSQSVLQQFAPFTKSYPIPKKGCMYYLCERGTCKTPKADFKELQL